MSKRSQNIMTFDHAVVVVTQHYGEFAFASLPPHLRALLKLRPIPAKRRLPSDYERHLAEKDEESEQQLSVLLRTTEHRLKTYSRQYHSSTSNISNKE